MKVIRKYKCSWIVTLFVLSSLTAYAQPAPAIDENIPFLVTFGADSKTAWGDDDFCQIFFCFIPPSQKTPFYIRVYDPDTSGDYDEAKGEFNTTINFSVYGGKGAFSDSSAQNIQLKGNYKSGFLLASKSFGADYRYNKKWYTFGPFNPLEGEYSELLGGRALKIIAQGTSGDDGNLYRYFLSSSPTENIPLEGGNFFTYKYHFRLSDNQKHISQIYPYVDNKTISIEISNFDWDNDGIIRIFSVAKNGIQSNVSGDDDWSVRRFPIVAEEKNSTVEIQFIKSQTQQVKNNNVVVTVRNQYGIALPFFVVPIGGVPIYSPKIRMK
jgi:hypothetical protein